MATSICFQNSDLSISIFQRKLSINVVYAMSIQSNIIINFVINLFGIFLLTVNECFVYAVMLTW